MLLHVTICYYMIFYDIICYYMLLANLICLLHRINGFDFAAILNYSLLYYNKLTILLLLIIVYEFTNVKGVCTFYLSKDLF